MTPIVPCLRTEGDITFGFNFILQVMYLSSLKLQTFIYKMYLFIIHLKHNFQSPVMIDIKSSNKWFFICMNYVEIKKIRFGVEIIFEFFLQVLIIFFVLWPQWFVKGIFRWLPMFMQVWLRPNITYLVKLS